MLSAVVFIFLFVFYLDFVYHITERVSASWLSFQEENDIKLYFLSYVYIAF